jgi:RecB family exonuclease
MGDGVTAEIATIGDESNVISFPTPPFLAIFSAFFLLLPLPPPPPPFFPLFDTIITSSASSNALALASASASALALAAASASATAAACLRAMAKARARARSRADRGTTFVLGRRVMGGRVEEGLVEVVVEVVVVLVLVLVLVLVWYECLNGAVAARRIKRETGAEAEVEVEAEAEAEVDDGDELKKLLMIGVIDMLC